MPAYRFDSRAGRLHIGGREVVLRPKTSALLSVLTFEPDRIHSKQELLNRIWPDVHVQDQAIFQCISEIRHAFGIKDCIRTHPRQGYQWNGSAGRAAAVRPGWQPFALTVSMCLAAVLLFAGALSSGKLAPPGDQTRVAVLPAVAPSSAARDQILPLGFMDMISRHVERMETVRLAPAEMVLTALEGDLPASHSGIREALDADILVRVAMRREGETLSAAFTIESAKGAVEGSYDSYSSAWLAEQISYEISDAIRYTFAPGAATAERIARQQSLIAARRALYGARPSAVPALAQIVADDPAYLSARYFWMVARGDFGARLEGEEVADLLRQAHQSGNLLNEVRALLLAAREAQRNGDYAAAKDFIGSGRDIAAQGGLLSLRAAFDLTEGLGFAADGAFDRAAEAFSVAAAQYRAADCPFGVMASYRNLVGAYRALDAHAKAQALNTRLDALAEIYSQAGRGRPHAKI